MSPNVHSIQNAVRVRLLKVSACSDPQKWYACMVGDYVPLNGGASGGQWRSREPAGYVNFIDHDDARVVHVFVPRHKLADYPFKHARAVDYGNNHEPITLPACAGRCGVMGVCQALPDCERGAGPAPGSLSQDAAQALRGQSHGGQSHRASAIEAAANIVLGFAISVAITAVLLPALGHDVTLAQNVAMTSVFTVASFARAYGLRRLFNWLQIQGKGASHD